MTPWRSKRPGRQLRGTWVATPWRLPLPAEPPTTGPKVPASRNRIAFITRLLHVPYCSKVDEFVPNTAGGNFRKVGNPAIRKVVNPAILLSGCIEGRRGRRRGRMERATFRARCFRASAPAALLLLLFFLARYPRLERLKKAPWYRWPTELWLGQSRLGHQIRWCLRFHKMVPDESRGMSPMVAGWGDSLRVVQLSRSEVLS